MQRNKERFQKLLAWCDANGITLSYSKCSLTEVCNSKNRRVVYWTISNQYENIHWVVLAHELGHIIGNENFDPFVYSCDNDYCLSTEMDAWKCAYKLCEELGLIDSNEIANMIGEIGLNALSTYANLIDHEQFISEVAREDWIAHGIEMKAQIHEQYDFKAQTESISRSQPIFEPYVPREPIKVTITAEEARNESVRRIRIHNKDVATIS